MFDEPTVANILLTAWRIYIVLMIVMAFYFVANNLRKEGYAMGLKELNLHRALLSLLVAGAVGVGGRVALALHAPEPLVSLMIMGGLTMLTLGTFHVCYAMIRR